MKWERQEAIRYLGGSLCPDEAGELVDAAYEYLQPVLRARSVEKVFPCVVTAESVRLTKSGNTKDRCPCVTSQREQDVASVVSFHSRDLAKWLVGCEQVVLFAATLGVGTDLATRRLALRSVSQAAAAQAVAASLIESYCDEVEVAVLKKYPGWFPRRRFSPGYGDWDLTDQKLILTLLDAQRSIGLTLTEGLMLAPTKSVTAIIGLSQQDSKHAGGKCANCTARCGYRVED